MEDMRQNAHWTVDNYRQRCTRKEAQSILINNPTVTYQGRVRHLKVKHVGAGVYEIFKEIKKEDTKY